MALQRFRAQVSRIRDLTHDVREIDLRLLEPAEMAFKAGQFISFEVPKPASPRPVVRPYSIASPPSQRKVLTLVLNLVPNGPGSTYLFGLKSEGETTFSGPAGTFYLRDDPDRDLLFIATGTGIAPLRSMLYEALARPDARRIELLWGLRSQRDLYYRDELDALSAAHARFHYTITLSRPDPGGPPWTGAVGRVTELVKTRVGAVTNLSVYLCGNSGMIADVTTHIRARGLCPIYREKYYDDAPGESHE